MPVAALLLFARLYRAVLCCAARLPSARLLIGFGQRVEADSRRGRGVYEDGSGGGVREAGSHSSRFA